MPACYNHAYSRLQHKGPARLAVSSLVLEWLSVCTESEQKAKPCIYTVFCWDSVQACRQDGNGGRVREDVLSHGTSILIVAYRSPENCGYLPNYLDVGGETASACVFVSGFCPCLGEVMMCKGAP